MGGRGATSQGRCYFVRQRALLWARSQIGSVEYAKSAELGDWKKNSWNCNAFVIRAFNYNNIPAIIEEKSNPVTLGVTKRAYSAKEFYEGKVPGFTKVDNPMPGDICADGKHVGIVSGQGKTISATEYSVVENDWGFRKSNNRSARFYRYTGIREKSSTVDENEIHPNFFELEVMNRGNFIE